MGGNRAQSLICSEKGSKLNLINLIIHLLRKRSRNRKSQDYADMGFALWDDKDKGKGKWENVQNKPQRGNSIDEFVCDQSMCSEALKSAFSSRKNSLIPSLNAINYPKHRSRFIMHMNNIIFQLGAYVLKSKCKLAYMLTVAYKSFCSMHHNHWLF